MLFFLFFYFVGFIVICLKFFLMSMGSDIDIPFRGIISIVRHLM